MSEISRDLERWLPVLSYVGYYEVSERGNVRSIDRVIPRRAGGPQRIRGRTLKRSVTQGGYENVSLCDGTGNVRTQRVHSLVLTAFVCPRPDGLVACHNDGNPQNNNLSNLRWDTQSNNLGDMRRHGTDSQVNKTHCPRLHLLVKPNLRSDTPEGRRGCLACHGAHKHARYLRLHNRTCDVQAVSDQKYLQIMRGGS